MTSIVTALCILCETGALGEESVFIIGTEYIEYEVGAEFDETI